MSSETERPLAELSWDELVELKRPLTLENRLPSTEYFARLRRLDEISAEFDRRRAMDRPPRTYDPYL
jgi:hypothetical protein